MLDMKNRAGDDEQFSQLLGQDILYLIIAALLGATMYLLTNKHPTPAEHNECLGKLEKCKVKAGLSDKDLEKSKEKLFVLRGTGWIFQKSSAELSEEFQRNLSAKIPEILERCRDLGLDLIEITGHPDESEVIKSSRVGSNLDQKLVALMRGEIDSSKLTAVDNVGYGMMRAAAIASFMARDGRVQLAGVTIVPKSAGQLVMTSGKVTRGDGSPDDADRRRITITLQSRREIAEQW
ncbi:MAG: hypothetical protein V1821_02970 [bacterium]